MQSKQQEQEPPKLANNTGQFIQNKNPALESGVFYSSITIKQEKLIMPYKNILASLVITGFGLTLAAPVMADSVAPAPTQIEQKTEIEQRKDALVAKEKIDKNREDAIEASRQAQDNSKTQELQRSKTKEIENQEQAAKNAQAVREKERQDILNNNKAH